MLSHLFVTSYGQAAALTPTTIYVYPTQLDLAVGEEGYFEIHIAGDQAVNVVSLYGRIVGTALELSSFDATGGVIGVFAEKPSVTDNTFRLVGGMPQGFSGDGIIGRLYVKAKKSGSAQVEILPSTSIFLNVPDPEPLTPTLVNAAADVVPVSGDYVRVTSRSHPDQSVWYPTHEASMHWDLVSGASYSYLVSRDPLAGPDAVADRPAGEKLWLGDIALRGLEDGVFYFSVKKLPNGPVSRYRLMSDITPPKITSSVISPGVPETQGKNFLSFSATDVSAGIDRAEVVVDNQAPVIVAPPTFVLPDGYQQLTLTVYDRAGNKTERVFLAGSAKASPVSILITVGVFVLLLIIFVILKRRRRPPAVVVPAETPRDLTTPSEQV